MPKLAAFLLFAAALPGAAAAASFTGSFSNVTQPGSPGGRCGPAPTLTLVFDPARTTGTSSFGAFALSASHCVLPTPPVTNYDRGLFSFAFDAGDTLFGTYTGTLSFVPNAPANVVQDYVVTGGTGRFDGASGTFRHIGTFAFGPGGVTTGQANFRGELSLVPEPASWALMILGFGAIGTAARHRASLRTRASFVAG